MNRSLADRLRLALETPPRQPLLTGDLPELPASSSTPAAVLAAITDRPEPGLLLTVRREHLRTHAGQIALPGGRVDPGESEAEAAVREAGEELGVPSESVELVGAIGPYRTITGYDVTPVIATIPPDLPLAPHDAEVADWFEAPLDFLLDSRNQRRKSAVFAGRERHYWEIVWEDRRIWGATAAILINLSRRLKWRR